jgi:ketosteroid isomerase-like protein
VAIEEAVLASNISLVRSGYEAQRRRDMARIFELLSPDIEIRQTADLPWGGEYDGIAGAKQFFASLGEHIESLVDVEEYFEAGSDKVIAIGRTRGRARKNWAAFDIRAVHVWTIKDGKAVRFEAYINTPEMLRILNDGGAD